MCMSEGGGGCGDDHNDAADDDDADAADDDDAYGDDSDNAEEEDDDDSGDDDDSDADNDDDDGDCDGAGDDDDDDDATATTTTSQLVAMAVCIGLGNWPLTSSCFARIYARRLAVVSGPSGELSIDFKRAGQHVHPKHACQCLCLQGLGRLCPPLMGVVHIGCTSFQKQSCKKRT